MVDQLPHHEAAFACLAAACGENQAVTSTHALAETYATLTAMPLPRRIQPTEARAMVNDGLSAKLSVLELSALLYRRAIDRVAARGLASGAVYDALQLVCAEEASCQRLHTYNLGHFLRLAPQGIRVLAP